MEIAAGEGSRAEAFERNAYHPESGHAGQWPFADTSHPGGRTAVTSCCLSNTQHPPSTAQCFSAAQRELSPPHPCLAFRVHPSPAHRPTSRTSRPSGQDSRCFWGEVNGSHFPKGSGIVNPGTQDTQLHTAAHSCRRCTEQTLWNKLWRTQTLLPLTYKNDGLQMGKLRPRGSVGLLDISLNQKAAWNRSLVWTNNSSWDQVFCKPWARRAWSQPLDF